MGVKTVLAGITLNAADLTQAEKISADPNGLMQQAQEKCAELIDLLGFIVADILTPASDAANIATVNTQITNLS